MKKILIPIVASLALLLSQLSFAEQQEQPFLLKVQKEWAVANYELSGDDKVKAFESLVVTIDEHLGSHPDNVEMWIWSGITKSTLAGAKGGLGALSLAKASRKDLEHALTLDEKALNGSAYTSLGTLYHGVPGWPVGFGSDKKAREFLQKALSINPKGIDPNYFYGEFLYDEGEYAEARKHLVTAQTAATRPNRPLADESRQQEVRKLLGKVEKKLKN